MPYIGKQPANVPVTADDIPNDSITSAKILDNVITISDIGPNAVGNSEMADDAIGLNELSATGTTNSSTFLRGDNTWATAGSTSASDLTSGTLPIARIADNAITTAKIAGDAITALKIADDVINATHIEDGQILTAALGADAVTGDKIANDSINSEHYVDGSIDTQHIADDQVTAAKLANSINTDIATGPAALPKAGGTVTGNILHNDNVVSSWGTGGDLSIYHDGSNSYIRDSGTGDIHIRSDAGFRVQNAGGTENYIYAAADGLVRLYHNNTGKLDTTVAGVTVSGNVTTSGVYNDGDLILESNSNIYLKRNTGGGATMLKAVIDGTVELYHDNTKKFETTAAGVAISGKITGAVGSVLQVIEAETGTAITFANDWNYDDVVGANITPSSTSSKIYVFVLIGGASLADGSGGGVYPAVKARVLAGPDTQFDNHATSIVENLFNLYQNNNQEHRVGQISLQCIDSPNSTAQQKYLVQAGNHGGSSQSGTYAGMANRGAGRTKIMLMEIGA